MSFKQKYRSNNGLARFLSKSKSRGPANPLDVGGMRRLYDGQSPRKAEGNARKTGFSAASEGPQNLDAPPRSPYTSAVPWMDVILTPAPLASSDQSVGMEEDFRDVATL
jgi:hypothetical protein